MSGQVTNTHAEALYSAGHWGIWRLWLVASAFALVALYTTSGLAQEPESWFPRDIPVDEAPIVEKRDGGWFAPPDDQTDPLAPQPDGVNTPGAEVDASPADVACDAQSRLIKNAAAKIDAGNIGEGEALLRIVDLSGCTHLAGEFVNTQTAAAIGRQKVTVAAGRAITSCDIAMLRQSADDLSMSMIPELQAQYGDLIGRISSIEILIESLNRVRQAFRSGAISEAEIEIKAVLAQIQRFGRDPSCQILSQQVTRIADEINELRAANSAGAAVTGSCSASAIEQAQGQLKHWQSRSTEARRHLRLLTARLTALRQAERLSDAVISDPAQENGLQLLAEVTAVRSALSQGADSGCASLFSDLDQAAEVLRFSTRAGPELTSALATCSWDNLNNPFDFIAGPEGLSFDEKDEIAGHVFVVAEANSLFDRLFDPPSGVSNAQLLDRIVASLDKPDVWYCKDLLAKTRQLQPRISEFENVLGSLPDTTRRCDADRLRTQMPVLKEISDLYPLYAELTGAATETLTYMDELKKSVRDAEAARVNGVDFAAMINRLRGIKEAIPKDNNPDICQNLRDDAERLILEMTEAQSALATVDDTLTQCRISSLDRYIDLAEKWPGSALTTHVEAVRNARKLVSLVDDLGGPDDPVKLDEMLSRVERFIKQADESAGLCAGPLGEVRQLFPDLLDIAAAVNAIDPAIRNCNLENMEMLAGKFGRSEYLEHPEVQAANEAVNVGILNCGPTFFSRATKACIAKLGTFGRAVKTSDNRYGCRCRSGYEKASNGKCRASIVLAKAAADQICRRRHGADSYADSVKSRTEFQCRCDEPKTMVDGRCATMTGSALKQYADDICRKEYGNLVAAVNLVSAEKFSCQCPKPNKWTEDRKRCYRPSTEEMIRDGWAACRKTYGNRLTNTIVGKDGSVTCYYK